MYGENKFMKIFSLVAFVAFAAVSCWSTTESLFLSLEHAEIPKWVFWIAVIGLYVLTSICFKMVLDSFNQNIYMERRTLKMIVGLLGVLLLWIAFSMPTNSHTFFYKQMAKDVASSELTYLDGELQKLSSESAFHESYNVEWNAYESEVLGALSAIKAEINDFTKPGAGQIAESLVAKVEDLLGLKTGTIARIKIPDVSQKSRNKACEHYDAMVKDQLAVKKQQHEANVARAYEDFRMKMKNVAPLRAQIEETLKQLKDDQYDKEAVLKNARLLAATANDELETQFGGLYQKNEAIYPSDRLVNVTKVWGDYMTGKFNDTNYTLWYWILLSVIVDIAAFAFFDIAFKKEDM